MRHTYPVKLHHFFTSQRHNYFTRRKFEVGDAPTVEHQVLEFYEGRGLEGDRFEEGIYPVTFFSLEVAQEIEKVFKRNIDITLYRRNITISGINLCELIGKEFRIGEVVFEGMAHCNPCTWLDAVIEKGTYREMKGRGGLRAKVIKGGHLSLGEATLRSDSRLIKKPVEAMVLSRLPKGL